MGDIHDDLREVMGLLGKATPGTVRALRRNGMLRDSTRYHLFDGRMHLLATMSGSMKKADEYEANAQAIAAAVNFLRQHGPALLARQEGEWLPIDSAPEPGVVHVRGLWVRTKHEGHEDEWNFCTYTGWVGEFGDFVDTEHGETFGWELDDYEYWMPLPAQPTDAAARSGGGG